MFDGLIFALTHVFCLVIGFYLCYATLAGRLLPRKTYNLQAAREMAEKYKVNKEVQDPSFIEKTLDAYKMDRESYMREGAGKIPLQRPPDGGLDGRRDSEKPAVQFKAH